MAYIFNMVLNEGHTDILNTVLHYLPLEYFKIAFLYEAYNAGDIPCPIPLWSGKCCPDWVEGGRWWYFPEVHVCLETIFSHLENKVGLQVEPQCHASRSHVLATHPFYPKHGQPNQPSGSGLTTWSVLHLAQHPTKLPQSDLQFSAMITSKLLNSLLVEYFWAKIKI